MFPAIARTRGTVCRHALVAFGAVCFALAVPIIAAGQTPPPAEAESAAPPPADTSQATDESSPPASDQPTPTQTPQEEPPPPKADDQPDAPPSAQPAPRETPPAEAPEKDSPPTDTSDTGETTGPTDAAELEAFIDGFLAAQMQDKHVAGATISVVVDNRPFFTQGYGYADVATKQPVDPDKTMFRIGSISKLFTWTAVMQLVEQGQLDLDADVNTYLEEFKIPATYSEPVTLRHLLSHTAGFEDHVIGLFAHDTDKLEPLGTILAREMPARVRKPGELASYSNHGTALAGYIVSQVSGMPWEDYVEQNILKPLGMDHTLLRQPPEDELPADLSHGYEYKNGRYEVQGFEYVPISPAGAVSSSAGDMARFMIAHLQDGSYDSARILKEETARQMREPLFSHHEQLPGMAYGFMRWSHNGQAVVMHGGDTFAFHSMLALLPERQVGLFFSYNTAAETPIAQELLEAFIDRYFPQAQTAPEPLAPVDLARLQRCAGLYAGIRYSHTTMAKLAALLGTATIAVDGEQLVVHAPMYGDKRFVEVEPLVFREVDGQETLVFEEDDDGEIRHAFISINPPTDLARVRWYETPTFTLALLGTCTLVFLSAVLGWPWAAFVGWGLPRHNSFGSRLASALGWMTSLAALVWLAGAVYFMREPQEIGYGITPLADGLLRATPLLAALVAVLALATLVAWLRGYWRFSGRLHYTCALLGGVAFVWFLYHWNLYDLPMW